MKRHLKNKIAVKPSEVWGQDGTIHNWGLCFVALRDDGVYTITSHTGLLLLPYASIEHLTSHWDIVGRRVLIEKKGFYV